MALRPIGRLSRSDTARLFEVGTLGDGESPVGHPNPIGESLGLKPLHLRAYARDFRVFGEAPHTAEVFDAPEDKYWRRAHAQRDGRMLITAEQKRCAGWGDNAFIGRTWDSGWVPWASN